MATSWDATLVPGAGFPDATIEDFRRLRSEQFGVRVQMILNDQHIRPGFLKVNRAFAPHLVIFNSENWPPGSYREFEAKQFRHVIGAVDTAQFQPRSRAPRDTFVVGAQISKNPLPLIEAMDQLPSNCVVRFFGFDRSGIFGRASQALGARVEYVGPLLDDALAAYYGDLDVMVSTEESAGWANIVAEAMASGVPVVTTRAGTLSIARDGETALIVRDTEPTTLAASIVALMRNASLGETLARNARVTIEQYDWRIYAKQIAQLVRTFDGASHYTHAPELGLFGKATLEERTDGLEPLLDQAPTLHSILDVGGAEGVLSNLFLKRGAQRVDVWEREESRVTLGGKLFGTRNGFSIQQGDLNREFDLKRLEARAPVGGYDLTLYLGVHQHLATSERLKVLEKLLSLTSRQFALRTPAATEASENLMSRVQAAGFVLEYTAQPQRESFAGPLYVFQRART